MPPTAPQLIRRERLEDLAREIGTLLMALTPLDAVLWADEPGRTPRVLYFLLAGLLLFEGAVQSEKLRSRNG